MSEEKMNKEEHKVRHLLLHRYFDELFADFIKYNDLPCLGRPIKDLLEWSYKQTVKPDHEV